mgnify:CR=1 FL=1
MSDFVKIVEVGPRDGLQNEAKIVDFDTKKTLIERLNTTGLSEIEMGAFVSPKWVPQMADSGRLFQAVQKQNTINYPMLVPNEKGLDLALAAGVTHIALFTAASDAFTQKNINCTIEESFDRFKPVIKKALDEKVKIRGYLSTVVACPYAGKIDPKIVAEHAKRFMDMGIYEISLGDTIGVATPKDIDSLLSVILKDIKSPQIALHLHDTYGQALANILRGLQMGVQTFDSSIAGLGGCPYAKGASGNVATEDVVYMLHGMGYKTGLDLDQLIEISQWISQKLDRENGSKISKARHPQNKP